MCRPCRTANGRANVCQIETELIEPRPRPRNTPSPRPQKCWALLRQFAGELAAASSSQHFSPNREILFAFSAPGVRRGRNESCMKKGKRSNGKELRREYKRSDFPKGFVRGKYASRLRARSNIVRLDPEIASAFPTSEAVNEALSAVLKAAKNARVSKRR